MKKNIFCLLLPVVLAGATHAQSKPRDMSRFSKAPVSGEVAAIKTVAPQATTITNGSSQVPDMSLFTKAPILAGGGGAAKTVTRTAATATNTTLPSNQAAEKSEAAKAAVPGLPAAAMEQLKMKEPVSESKPAPKQ
jgi:hypothetical protein